MNLLRKIARFFANTAFVRDAIEERADLSAFKKHRTAKDLTRNILGISLIVISYIIGWPAVILLGVISIYTEEPLVVVIGGPVIYGLSHLMFLIGMYITGAPYTIIFLKWASRVIIEKILADQDIPPASNNHAEEITNVKK